MALTNVSAESLGRTIAAYRPPLRRKLALELALSALPAAGLWYLMVWLEHSLLIPLLALAALPLSFHSLNLFLRWLGPGKRIAVHEHGLLIQRDSIPWKSIATIHYQLDLGSEHSTIETQLHKFEFLLKDGSTKLLALEHSSVDSHVNIEQFIEHLRSAPPLFEADHEPKLRIEAVDATPVSRNPEMAAQLRAGLDAEIASAQHSGIAAKVVSAFNEGRQLRASLARKASLSSLSLELFVILSTFVLSVMILAGIISALILIIATVQGITDLLGLNLDLLDKSDFPIALPTFVITVVITSVCFLLAGKLSDVTEAAKLKAQKLIGLKQGLSARAPEQTVAALLAAVQHGTPYALYLRSFAAEHFVYQESTPIGGSDYTINTERLAVERDLDVSLVTAAAGRLPVFALANANDPSAAHELDLLFVPDEDWLSAVVELVCDAHVVIVHLAAVTESLLLELELLDRLALGDRTLLLRSDSFSTGLLCPQEQSTLARFKNQLNVDKTDWNAGLADFLHTTMANRQL